MFSSFCTIRFQSTLVFCSLRRSDGSLTFRWLTLPKQNWNLPKLCYSSEWAVKIRRWERVSHWNDVFCFLRLVLYCWQGLCSLDWKFKNNLIKMRQGLTTWQIFYLYKFWCQIYTSLFLFEKPDSLTRWRSCKNVL